MAHDFNNVLSALQGSAYLARKRVAGDEYLDGRLSDIEDLVDRAVEIVNRLLTFARREPLETEVVSLNKMAAEGFRLGRAMIPANIEFDIGIGEEPMAVVGNESQLHQIIMNLLSNAVDAVELESHPQISFTLTQAQPAKKHQVGQLERGDCRCAKLSVSDNGCGIEPDALDLVFDPFYTTKETGKGTGLGLASVFGITRTHHGVAEVDSALHAGTTISVYLPLTDQMPVPRREDDDSTVCGEGRSVLLVDDDEHVRRMAADMLRLMEFDVIEACDGVEALRHFLAANGTIDLVLCDVVMPQLGGVELLHEVRQVKPAQPFLLMTGYDRNRELSTVAGLANCEVIGKPFNFTVLTNALARLTQTLESSTT